MNLIEQLKQTPKWSKFEEWWREEYDNKLYIGDENYLFFYAWCQFPFEMQESMFRKFIGIGQNKYPLSLFVVNKGKITWNTFEELILWYFNN